MWGRILGVEKMRGNEGGVIENEGKQGEELREIRKSG